MVSGVIRGVGERLSDKCGKTSRPSEGADKWPHGDGGRCADKLHLSENLIQENDDEYVG